MKVELGKFALSSIEAHSGADLAGGVRAALHHYVYRLGSSLALTGPPRFLVEGTRSERATSAFEVAVPPEIEAVLESHAHRHQVPLSQVLAHAVFTYLADLEAAAVIGRPRRERQSSPVRSAEPSLL